MGQKEWGIFLDRIATTEGLGFDPIMMRNLVTQYRAIAGIHNVAVWAEKGDASYLVSGYLQVATAMESVSQSGDQSIAPPPWAERRLFVGERIFESTPPSPRTGPSFFTIYMQPQPEMDEEFNDWYNTEHIPRLLTVPGCMGGLRFKESGLQPTYVAVYYLTHAEVWGSKAWRDAADSPWRTRIMKRVHVLGGRTVYNQVQL